MTMFAMESQVAQLRPETIASLVGDAEEHKWSQLGIPGESEEDPEIVSPIQGSAELGEALLRHGTCVKKIQNYFSHLESRKCCLLLAGRRSTFSNVRVVKSDGQDNGFEEGAMKRPTVTHTHEVQQLDNKEFRAFKHAYLCASFPVLGAPSPPSPMSPSPNSDSTPTSFQSVGLQRRASTPTSLHDSGVEENDEGAMIPTETLCELLRRSFKLSSEKFHQYETIIAKTYHKKSPPKLLAEELVGQLRALEYNINSFYNPAAFLSRNGYDIWYHMEMAHIAELLNKFWHFSLPLPSDGQIHAKDLSTVHEDYEIILSKLIEYEQQFKVGNDNTTSPLYTLLSSASQRLLREFGLRYGIAEQYRRILYLRHLTDLFTPSVWFLQHITQAIDSIRDLLPNNISQLVMTRKEFLLLDASVKSVLVQAAKSFGQMQRIFETVKPAEGSEILIGLISTTLELRSYLTLDRQETLEQFLYRAVQNIFRPAYERHKALAISELMKKNKCTTVTPVLLNILISNIRDDVTDYCNNYHAAFSQYLNITETASQSYYILLMEDVQNMCVEENREVTTEKECHEINLLMLGLAYRLNRLDQDWAEYIPPDAQLWRKNFLLEILKWSSAMEHHVKGLIQETVTRDTFTTQEIHLASPLSSLARSTCSGNRCPSVSAKSLTPSMNSAFSSLVSSVRSTPIKQLAKGSAFDPVNKIPRQPSTIPEASFEVAPSPVTPVPKPEKAEPRVVIISKRGSFETKSLIAVEDIEDGAGVKGMKQSASLPEMKSKEHSQMDPSGRLWMTASGDLDSCPFMPLLNESDEMSSHDSQTNHCQTQSDIDGSGIVFRARTQSEMQEGCSQAESQGRQTNEYDSEETGQETSSLDTEINAASDDEQITDTGDDEFQFPPIKEVSHAQLEQRSPHLLPESVHIEQPGILAKLKSAFQSFRKESTSESKDIASRDQHGPMTFSTAGPSSYGNGHGSSNHQDFMDSFSSNITIISLPTPPPGSETCLPVSGSAVDMIVILQRLVVTGQTMYQLLYPTLDDLEVLEAVENGDLSMGQLEFHRQNLAGKQQIFESFLKTICILSCLYADNIFCVDLCGTPQAAAKRLVGPQLIEHLSEQQHSSQIAGCRHELNGSHNCFEYVNKATEYLADRYEPISQEMCIRINDVAAILKFLEVYERQMSSMFGEKDTWISAEDTQRTSVAHTGRESRMSMQDFSSLDHFDPDKDDSFEMGRDSSKTFGLFDPHQSHILGILKAQCRLLAYRLNLFLRDALSLLLNLKPTYITIEDCLRPMTNFLVQYLEKFSSWLYKNCFREVLECLWVFLVQDIEGEADKLRLEENLSPAWAQTLIQTITYLLRLMNNFGKGITRNLLLSQADDLVFKLKLYSLSSHQIIALYKRLTEYSLGERGLFPDEVEKPVPTVILLKIQRDLQKFRKCFSGRELIQWIFRNRELFYKIEPVMVDRNQPFTKEIALDIIVKFLDFHYIVDVETENETSRSPSPVQNESPYPEVSIHSKLTRGINYKSSSSDLESDRASAISPLAQYCGAQEIVTSDSEKSAISSDTLADEIEECQLTDSRLSPRILNQPVFHQPEDIQITSTARLSPQSADKGHSRSNQNNLDAKNHPEHDLDQHSSEGSANADPTHANGIVIGQERHCALEDKIAQDGDNKCKIVLPQQTDIYLQQQILESSGSETNKRGLGPVAIARSSLNQFASLSDVQSLSSVYTPLSFSSETAYLIDSSDHFFCVVPLPSEENVHQSKTSFAMEWYMQENLRHFNKLNHSRETADMVEKCFQKKIKPVFLLSVLYGQAKSDVAAKQFLRRLPSKVLDRVKNQAKRPSENYV